VIFRGVADEEQMWPIAIRSFFKSRGQNPGAGDERMLDSFRRYEAGLFADFRREAILLAEHIPADECQWLALAQHHGLPTRLLDWSRSPIVALYFAAARDHESNCRLYGYDWEPVGANVGKTNRPHSLPARSWPERISPIQPTPPSTLAKIVDWGV
jgi:hypothetical protein